MLRGGAPSPGPHSGLRRNEEGGRSRKHSARPPTQGKSNLFQRLFRGGGGQSALARCQQAQTQLGVDLIGNGRVVAQELADIFLALADTVALVAVPGAGLVDEVLRHAQLDDLALARGALAVEDLELSLAEWRRHLVLDHLD